MAFGIRLKKGKTETPTSAVSMGSPQEEPAQESCRDPERLRRLMRPNVLSFDLRAEGGVKFHAWLIE
jgi:hypothetical protein